MQRELPQLHRSGEGIREGDLQGEQMHGGGGDGCDHIGDRGCLVSWKGPSQAIERAGPNYYFRSLLLGITRDPTELEMFWHHNCTSTLQGT